MEREDWEGFWRHWAKEIGVYGVVVYFALRHKPDVSYGEIEKMAGISYRQVLRAIQTLTSYNLILISVGTGGKKTEIQLLDPVDWFVRPVSWAPWPDTAITCDRHDWGREDNSKQCRHCGLLKAEEEYKRAGMYNLTPEQEVMIDAVNKPFLESLNA